LLAWGRGDRSALDQLVPLVEDELRRLARRQMARERVGHTLQATALVNEAYLRLIEVNQVQWQNRAHFFAMASRMMRRILVDAARAHRFQKRGGDAERVSLDEALVVSHEPRHELIALDDALNALGQSIFARARSWRCDSLQDSASKKPLKPCVFRRIPSCATGGWPGCGCYAS
jgi:RNA polymerase sigma factor (TIGR02999 family)